MCEATSAPPCQLTVNKPLLINIQQWVWLLPRPRPSSVDITQPPPGARQSTVRVSAAVSRCARGAQREYPEKRSRTEADKRFRCRTEAGRLLLPVVEIPGGRDAAAVHVPSGGLQTRSGGSHRLSLSPDSRQAAARRRHDPHTELRPPPRRLQPAAPAALRPHPGTQSLVHTAACRAAGSCSQGLYRFLLFHKSAVPQSLGKVVSSQSELKHLGFK